MKIKDMFQKDIERPLNGVVQITRDYSGLMMQELEEYVVTEELERSFDIFFDNYCKSIQHQTTGTGVWISGYYGSGKTYFLKILSSLLSGWSCDGRDAVSYMERKIDNKRIIDNMRKAAELRAAVIPVVFPMEKSYENSRDAMVQAFTNAFYTMRGFCGSMPWVADLECQMAKQGRYMAFKERFKELSGSDWEAARENFYFEEENIVTALTDTAQMSRNSARAWYNTAEKNYFASSEVFADSVKEYITEESEARGKKQFVVFLCDNVESVIDGRENLLLNFQTLVEEIGIRCGGQAWVIAAACRDIDGLVEGCMSDTSKVKKRFGIRLSLSGANTEEIVKKVLLRKTDCADAELRSVYEEKSAVLKELVPAFSNLPEQKVDFSEDDFVETYPFMPYQIDVLQASLASLGIHGGTRSLLHIFKQAAAQYKDFDAGTLIPFNSFYGEIELFLDTDIREVLIKAGKWTESPDRALHPFDVEVLKVLGMIKYISHRLPSTPENIATIMMCYMNQDRDELKKEVLASLHRLLGEGLITENGGQFSFQNIREQEINKKIRAVVVDDNIIFESLCEDIFKILLGEDSVYHYGSHYDFPLNIIVSHQPYGIQDGELGIHVLIPRDNDGDGRNPQLLSTEEKNVIVSLRGPVTFWAELKQALQIDVYIWQTSGKTYSDKVEEIRNAKIEEGKQRAERCSESMRVALREAEIYVCGKQLRIDKTEPSMRIKEAFGVLVESFYTKLNYITHFYFSIDRLWEVFNQGSKASAGGKKKHIEQNQLAVREMSDFISNRGSDSLTLRSLMHQFAGIPYGWKRYDIAGILLTLFQRQEVRLELNGRPVGTDDRNVIAYVTEPKFFDCIAVKKQIRIKPELLNNARNIAEKVFCKADIPEEESELMICLQTMAEKELSRYDIQNPGIRQLLGEYDKTCYPGKTVLEKSEILLESLIGEEDIYSFFHFLWKEKKKILECWKELQTVKSFFWSQKEIFDQALTVISIYEKERFYLQKSEIVQIVDDIEKIIQLPSPYSGLDKIQVLVKRFYTHYKEVFTEECRLVRTEIEADREMVCNDLERRVFTQQYYDDVEKEFTELKSRLVRAHSICEALAMRTESERIKYRFLQRFDQDAFRLSEREHDNSKAAPLESAQKIKNINLGTLITDAAYISNERDIDALEKMLRAKLEAELEENTAIRII